MTYACKFRPYICNYITVNMYYYCCAKIQKLKIHGGVIFDWDITLRHGFGHKNTVNFQMFRLVSNACVRAVAFINAFSTLTAIN